jgi:protein TonB
MTPKLMPRIGEMFADRSEHARRDDAGVRGAVVGSLAPIWSPTRRSSNVIPFIRPDDCARRQLDITADLGMRASLAQRGGAERTWLASLLLLSAAAHAIAFIVFEREPPPLASVGVQAMSVEIVLGSDAAAGLSKTPTQSEASVDSAASKGAGAELVKPETAREEVKVASAVEPVATAVVDAKTAPQVTEAKPPPLTESKPPQQVAVPEKPTVAVTAADALPTTDEIAPQPLAVEPPKAVAALPPKPTVATIKPQVKPKKRPAVHERHQRGEDARTRESRSSAASVASSGIGRGRSDADTNYRGLVAAQLARNKSFPPEARRNGDHGTALVSFTIDAGGQVGQVSLVRPTGVLSLDREAQAMVRRAAPFPPPPSQHAMRFTVPVSFNLQ